jgi:DNA primase
MALFPQPSSTTCAAGRHRAGGAGTVSLRRVGSRYVGLCPFHNEKTPSFGVDRERGFFHCFGCGVGGNVFKFVELHERLSFPEAVPVLAKKFGVAIPRRATPAHDPRPTASARA